MTLGVLLVLVAVALFLGFATYAVATTRFDFVQHRIDLHHKASGCWKCSASEACDSPYCGFTVSGSGL